MKRILLLIATVSLIGCSDANISAFAANGSKHRIALFSGGVKVGEWVSSGKIENEQHSDGYYFKDSSSGKLVSISGTVIITQE